MVTIQSFKQAHTLHNQNLIPFRLLQLQAFTLLSILPDHPYQSIQDTLDITPTITEWLVQQSESSLPYLDYFGGHIYICEVEADLLHIKAYEPVWSSTHAGEWPNVTDTPLVFDICEYIPELSKDAEWFLFVSITNNAGGDSFYVPQHLWTAARVAEHFALSQTQ